MKIALDIHGVISEKPEFFKKLMHSICLSGGEVHILSGPPMDKIKFELAQLGIGYFTQNMQYDKEIITYSGHFTSLFSIVDYLKQNNIPLIQDSKGNFHAEEYLWDRAKGDYCLRYNIDLMIDDSDAYSSFFKTPYARYYSKTKRTHWFNPDKQEK